MVQYASVSLFFFFNYRSGLRKVCGVGFAVVDHAVGMEVSVGNEEADYNVDEKGELAGDIQQEEVLGESFEEPKLQRSEGGGVDCPYQNEVYPCHVPPAHIQHKKFINCYFI